MEREGPVFLIDIFTPKEGKTEEFIRAQFKEYCHLEGKVPGWLGNRLHLSIDEKKVVNCAEFESLQKYIDWRNSETFKKHCEVIKDLIEKSEPGIYTAPLYNMKRGMSA